MGVRQGIETRVLHIAAVCSTWRSGSSPREGREGRVVGLFTPASWEIAVSCVDGVEDRVTYFKIFALLLGM